MPSKDEPPYSRIDCSLKNILPIYEYKLAKDNYSHYATFCIHICYPWPCYGIWWYYFEIAFGLVHSYHTMKIKDTMKNKYAYQIYCSNYIQFM
jgi:hypothetical protein